MAAPAAFALLEWPSVVDLDARFETFARSPEPWLGLLRNAPPMPHPRALCRLAAMHGSREVVLLVLDRLGSTGDEDAWMDALIEGEDVLTPNDLPRLKLLLKRCPTRDAEKLLRGLLRDLAPRG